MLRIYQVSSVNSARRTVSVQRRVMREIRCPEGERDTPGLSRPPPQRIHQRVNAEPVPIRNSSLSDPPSLQVPTAAAAATRRRQPRQSPLGTDRLGRDEPPFSDHLLPHPAQALRPPFALGDGALAPVPRRRRPRGRRKVPLGLRDRRRAAVQGRRERLLLRKVERDRQRAQPAVAVEAGRRERRTRGGAVRGTWARRRGKRRRARRWEGRRWQGEEDGRRCRSGHEARGVLEHRRQVELDEAFVLCAGGSVSGCSGQW